MLIIHAGEPYHEGDDVEIRQLAPTTDPPPETVRGEPWGWTKPGPRPRGWPGPDQSHDDPGPFDGSWVRSDDTH